MITYTLPSPTELSGFYVLYKGSSTAEDESLKGASHMLEHLVSKYLTPLILEMNQYAVEYGATTSDDYVCYYITGLEEYVAKYTDVLFQKLTEPISFSQDDFDKEKIIIMREINTKRINPSNKMVYQFLKENLNYDGSAGTISSVNALTLEQIKKLYTEQYKEPYMTIRVSNQCFYNMQQIGPHHSLKPIVSLEKLTQHLSLPCTTNENVFMAVSPVIHNSFLPLSQIINYMLCGTIESPLLKKLREQMQLCYSVDVKYFPLGDYHFNYIYVVLPSEMMQSAKVEIKQILNDALFLTAENIKRTKKYFSILDRIHKANRYADIRHLLYNTIYAVADIESIECGAVVNHYNLFYRSSIV